jgi:hypothetical protein
MKRLFTTTLLSAALLGMAFALPASADFGFSHFDVTYPDSAGEPVSEAGAHPFAQTTSFDFNRTSHPNLGIIPDEALRDQIIGQIPGFVGDTTLMPACPTRVFLEGEWEPCPGDTDIGRGEIRVGSIKFTDPEGEPQSPNVPIYNLTTPSGAAARIGFKPFGVPVVVLLTINPDPPYNVLATASSAPQTIPFYGADITIWGNPSDPAHDVHRGVVSLPERPFLTLPRACLGPLEASWRIRSWQSPGSWLTGGEAGSGGEADAFEDCAALGFMEGDSALAAAPTTNRAESPSGFEFTIDVDNPGLTDPDERADSDLKKAVVTLPEGLTVNPAAANGLDACTSADLKRETAASSPGAGCPDASTVAHVEVTSPLLTERLDGSIFLAEPFKNPLGSLLAGYLVIKQRERGIVVKLAGKIETDPATGRITASFDENPQLPFSHLEVSFPGGPRGALTTPQACGDYEIRTELYPWSGNAPLVQDDSFRVAQAPGSGSCASSESALPNTPGFDAGTVEPLAGRHSAFVVNLRREDGTQRFRRVTLTPPPGLTAKLAGTPPCSDAALAAAAAKAGKSEQRSPSCPAVSRVGSVFAAAGSGPAPYWAPGAAYLAGPYKGAPLSIAVVAPAVAGPFDLGTIVVRTAVHVNPSTAQITAISDPFPHILQGIPLDVRTVSVRLDKPQFALNPTSCDPMAFGGALISTLGANAGLHSPFQVAECGRLGFKPRIGLRIFGGIKRGKYQGLRAVVRPRPGDANIGRTVVRFPRTAFVAQENFRTICTRVQFAADACPKGSIYGRATASSPLLDYPLAGNVYLRSSDNTLPDVVADLRGPAHQPIRIELVGRTDSVKGALRNTFDVVPDAPVSYFRLNLFGGSKSLIVNSRNVCAGKNRAAVVINAQSGVRRVLRPRVLNPRCKKVRKQAKRKRAKQRRRAQRSAVVRPVG